LRSQRREGSCAVAVVNADKPVRCGVRLSDDSEGSERTAECYGLLRELNAFISAYADDVLLPRWNPRKPDALKWAAVSGDGRTASLEEGGVISDIPIGQFCKSFRLRVELQHPRAFFTIAVLPAGTLAYTSLAVGQFWTRP
jgi:hypothetical protein